MSKFDLTGHFLIAMPNMLDPGFHQTVTYLCSHTNEGAMGIIVNRPMKIGLGEILSQMDMDASDPAISESIVFEGGPVQQDRGIIIHDSSEEWDSMIAINNHLAVATSRDILEAISAGRGPKRSLVALGYAGWGAGQLEMELADNGWLNTPAEDQILFDVPPEERWKEATRLLGIDTSQISPDVGHG